MRFFSAALLALPLVALGCSSKSSGAPSLASIPDPVGNYTPIGGGDPLPEGDPYDPFADAGAVEEDASVATDAGPAPTDAGLRPDAAVVLDGGRPLDAGVATDAGGAAGPDCPNGSGYYCGGNGVAGDANTLYYCYKTGKIVVAEVCQIRCVKSVADVDDYCAAR